MLVGYMMSKGGAQHVRRRGTRVRDPIRSKMVASSVRVGALVDGMDAYLIRHRRVHLARDRPLFVDAFVDESQTLLPPNGVLPSHAPSFAASSASAARVCGMG